MNTTVQALLELYVSLGGKLTDSYSDISEGVVGDYTTIPDCIKAVQKVAQTGKTIQMHWNYTAGGLSPFDAETDMTPDEVWSAVENGNNVVAVLTTNGKPNGDLLTLYSISREGRYLSFCSPKTPSLELAWVNASQKWLFYNTES